MGQHVLGAIISLHAYGLARKKMMILSSDRYELYQLESYISSQS